MCVTQTRVWDNTQPAICEWDMTTQTQHLAVLFADISDSTKLYNTLGDNAARTVVTTCLTLISGVVERFKGRVVKTIGDEVMCVFRRADDAVLAAGEMQAQVDAQRPGEYHLQIHIGLHYGPVLVEDDDVFGDTVNAAAYLTAVASAEQILTTEATEHNLSPELRSSVRPVFKVVLRYTIWSMRLSASRVHVASGLEPHRLPPRHHATRILPACARCMQPMVSRPGVVGSVSLSRASTRLAIASLSTGVTQ